MGTALLKKLWPALALLLVVALCVGGGYWWGSSDKEVAWKIKWAQRDKDDLQNRQAFTQDQRRLELKRQGDIDAIQAKADEAIATAGRNAAAARAESGRLRKGIGDAIARLAADSGDASTAQQRAAKASTGVLLTELYRVLDDAATRYAIEADANYDIGKRCEASYDAVRNDK